MIAAARSRIPMPFPTVTRIETPRLLLRPVEATDLPNLMAVNGDPEVTRFLPYDTWKSAEDGEAWFARSLALGSSGTGQLFALVARSTGTVLGTLVLFRYDEASRRVELGYVLGRAHWGRGWMSEAIAAACSFAFDELGIRRIEAEVNPANVASCVLLTRVGFTFEGRLRKRWVAKGVDYDTNIYGWLAEDRLAAGAARQGSHHGGTE
jgi:ribosomal-protein-alanine N-acetyltransferase